jgi:YD repeat-containing protein
MKILFSLLILASCTGSAYTQLAFNREILKYPLKSVIVYCQKDTSRAIAKKELFYDQNHRLVKECETIYGNINCMTYTYNESGALILQESESRNTVFTYNNKNQLICENEDKFKTTSYEYNGERVSSKLVDLGSGSKFYTYKYDKQNRLAEIYLNDQSYISYEYTDSLLRRESHYGRQYGNFETTEYKYDYNTLGQLVKKTENDKILEKYIYDNNNRLIERMRYEYGMDPCYYPCCGNYIDKFEYYPD